MNSIRGIQRLGFPLLFILGVYAMPLASRLPATNPNETARIELAASIAFWARLDITPAAEAYGVSEDVAFREGRMYSDKAPGLSLGGIPILWIIEGILPREAATDLPSYWPVRHLLTLLLVAIPTAGLAFLISSVVPGADPHQRSALAVVTALATPLWTYATVFFGHAPAALMILIAWVLLLRLGMAPATLDRRSALLGGVAAGLAFSAEYPTILLVAVIFGVLVIRRTPLPILGLAAAAALAGAAPALLYHHLAFGAPWLTGYTFKANADFQAIHTTGILGIAWPTLESIWGVLFSAKRGIFYFCPVLLLAPLGLHIMVQRDRWRDAAPIVAGVALYLFFAAGFVDWEAGWCAAARHLIPVIPLLAIPSLAAVVRIGRSAWGSVAVVMLVAVSAIHAMLSIAVTPFFPPQFLTPLAQIVIPSFIDGAAAQNFVSNFTGIAAQPVIFIMGFAVVMTLAWSVIRLVRDRSWWYLSLIHI